MLYQDLTIKAGKGIYAALLDNLGSNNIASDLITAPSDLITAQKLDTRFSFENNLKECLFDDLDNASNVLVARYSFKWSKLLAAFNSTIPDGASNYTVTNSKQNVNNINSISAYDSDDLLKDSGANSDATGNTSTTIYDLSGQELILNLYSNSNIYDIINTDIRKTLFKNIQVLDREY